MHASKIIRALTRLIIKRKITSAAIALVLIGGGYFGYTKIFSAAGVVRYATAQVQKGTLIVSISGSGQVSASNQVDIKPKASGEIIAVYAESGQEAGAGDVLAIIDPRDAQRAVRDAQTGLETAQLELDKILEPLDELTLLQAENSLIQTKESKQKAEDDIKKAYEDGFNVVSNSFLDLPGIMTGLQDMLFESTLGAGAQWNIDYYANAVKIYDEKVLRYQEDTRSAYQTARAAYDKNFADYKSTSRFADHDTIASLISETYDTTKEINEAVKNANNLIQFYQDKLTERSVKPHALS
ncbi:MAG: biotin/lipoyl-binding protein, partial [Candidatus Sungiibacteriota bacterium]